MRFIEFLYRSLFLVLIGGMLVGGCTNLRNEISPDLLGVEKPKLVVTCFLSPQDTTLTVKVTRSNTVVGDSISLLQTGNNVTDATVTLSESDRTVTLIYERPMYTTVGPYYSVDARLLPIVAGHTYTLTVVGTNGERATSTCTIPRPISVKTITYDSLTENTRGVSSTRYYATAYWQDSPDQVNYYQLAGIFRYSQGSYYGSDKYNTLTFDNENRGLLSDEDREGKEMNSGNAYITTPSGMNFPNQYSTASVTINLMSIDQAYYRFQEAIIRQRRSRNNPFAEPVLIPSNITGGLGCFAGYNNAILTKTLK